VVAALSLALWFRALGKVAIPKNRSIYVATWAVAAGLGVAALLGEPGWLGGVPAGIGTFLSVFFLFTVVIRPDGRAGGELAGSPGHHDGSLL
jgi:hypothetical protein